VLTFLLCFDRVAVGGDGTVLSSAHFLDHGTIPLLGINSDPNVSEEDKNVKQKLDERRSHGALCMLTAYNMEEGLQEIVHGGGHLQSRCRMRCKVKSTFSETLLVPALNDLLISNPSPAAVSRFRLGWMNLVPTGAPSEQYGTVTRFGGNAYDVRDSLNVWSSGMWLSTATGSTAAMKAAGGKVMPLDDMSLQYLIREHMIERNDDASPSGSLVDDDNLNNGMIGMGEKLHVRWNSQKGKVYIDGSHLTHNLELGDEILIDNKAPPLKLYARRPL
jgi:NAD+ kinase